MRRFGIALFVILILAGVSAGQQITIDGIDLQEVGDPGNAPDTNGTGYGQVGYAFKMGKYDTTVNQYVAFLNAVGSTDPYNCYDGADMDYLPVSSTGSGSNFGCGIVRSGTFGSYTYALDPNLPAGGFNWGDLPVNFVSWGSAARYCNWLDNGMPTTGQETVGTTEQGSYTLNGATSAASLMAITRNFGARWVIPNMNEWYKAAYYKGGGQYAGYWDYPTQSNTAPINNPISPSQPNCANFYDYYGTGNSGYAIGLPYYRNPGGYYSGSPGPYGTYDQGGDLRQWNEGSVFGTRMAPGGSFDTANSSNDLEAVNAPGQWGTTPDQTERYIGIRVAAIPLPGDANDDGTVDINDLTIVLANLGQTGMAWYQGEFTGSGTVDINDLTIVLARFGYTYTASLAAVPEPCGLALTAMIAIAGLGLFCSRKLRA